MSLTAFIVIHNPYLLTLLKRGFPQPVQIAILIHGHDLLVADAHLCLGLILQIDTDSSSLGLDVDKYDMVLLGHGVRNATHLDLELSIAQILDHGHMLLAAGICRIGDQLLHLLTTTYHLNARIYHLLDHIATVAALVKFCCHKYYLF